MKSYKKILVPTDFSDGAKTAYGIARQIAAKFGGKIDLMNVIPSVEYLKESLKKIPVAVEPDDDIIPDIVKQSESRLKKTLGEFDEKVRGKIHIGKNRKAADSIIHYSKDHHYDLIVMGSKGENKTLMNRGSVTLRTLRNSSVPIIAVGEMTKPGDIKRVLLPTDSSQLSLSALPHAAALAHAFGAELALLYVIELRGGGGREEAEYDTAMIDRENIYEQLMEKIAFYLTNRDEKGIELKRSDKLFLDSLKTGDAESEKYIPLKTIIRTGHSVHYEIEKYAEKNADLVVMATHGYSGFAHLFLGSMTEKVVQNMSKPVMTTRPTDQEFEHAQKSSIGMVTIDPLP
ncbi:universal stress protein [Rhodohalobacter halophilus]|uniref:universal stress protein n=1 Tax=Rhodohalobacter halophilus TaxID=1812810 RepID=UPI00083FA7F8|nr:universal stress protein [Rhodohalobacter halophilus]